MACDDQLIFENCSVGDHHSLVKGVALRVVHVLCANSAVLVPQPSKNKVVFALEPKLEGAHRALCPRCAKSRLFSTTGSNGSQGPEFCSLQPLLVHQGFFFV